MSKIRVVIIGSLPHVGVDKTFGGATILMQSLVRYCEKQNIPVKLIQANKYLGLNAGLKNFFNVIGTLLSMQKKDFELIMLNSSRNGAMFLGPLIFLISKYKSRKFVFRMFGGNFDQIFKNMSVFRKFILKRTVLKSDIVYFETKQLIKYFKSLVNNDVKWLPNVREKRGDLKTREQDFKKRFVFISQVMESKGVDIILEAVSRLSEDYRIDIYGPLKDEKYIDFDFNACNVRYQGVLEPGEVCATLLNYDVLLLPTYYEGEGYPGIIIEAFSTGMPVITTNWKAIPEIVNRKNGVLIDPQNTSQLVKAIEFFTQKNYSSFSAEAFKSFNNFDEEEVYEKMFSDFDKIR